LTNVAALPKWSGIAKKKSDSLNRYNVNWNAPAVLGRRYSEG